MYAAIHIPDFSLQAVLRRHPELAEKPVALLDPTASEKNDRNKARIIQLTAAARCAGVEPGMTATQGQARCPHLHLLVRSESDEKSARHLLLACGAAHAPDIEDTAPGICTLDLLGNRCPPDSFEKLGDKIRNSLATSSLEARVGVAANPDLALLAARLARSTVVIRAERDEIGRFLSPLPVEAVEPSAELLSVFELWGVHTLGELTALPAQDVIERLGPEAARLWEQATGGRRRLLRLLRPPANYSQEIELEHPIEKLDPLLFLIRRILETIAARLAAAYRVAEEITLHLTLDDGTHHRRRFRVPDPSRDVDLLFRMIHTYLDGVTTEAPVVALRIAALPARPGASQFHLFESSLRDPNRFSETMARLEALLGSDRVGTPSPAPTHRPDRFSLEPFAETAAKPAAKPAAKNNPAPAPPPGPLALGLPLRRFRPPLPVNVLTQYDPTHAVERPRELHSRALSGRLLQRRGPWLGSGDWWDRDSWSREEWDVQLDTGTLYRLVREDHHWLVEGVYG